MLVTNRQISTQTNSSQEPRQRDVGQIMYPKQKVDVHPKMEPESYLFLQTSAMFL